MKALSDQAQPTRMVSSGVAQEVGVVGGKECLAAEGSDARSATVVKTRGRFDDEALIGRKSGFAKAIAEARAEVHIFPPRGLESGVKATQSLPHRASHQPRSGSRLWNGCGSLRRSRKRRRTGQTEGESSSAWKVPKLPSVL